MRIEKEYKKSILENQEIFVGLEDSKKTWKLCVRSLGIIVKETSMPSDYHFLRNFLNNQFPECRIKLIYEAGFSGFNLYDQLKMDGCECVVTPSHRVTQEKCSPQKNDRIDSRRLAKVLETGDYHSCFVPEKQLREDRQISRLYDQNQRDIRQTCNRFRRLLEFHGLDRNFKSGRWTPRNYIEAWEKCREMDLSKELMFAIEEIEDKLKYLWGKKKRYLEYLSELSHKERYDENFKLLMSVPGIGKLTAIRFLLELNEIDRFNRKEQFASFLGLVPREYSSGEKDHKGHITKQGSKYLRSCLVESAWIAIKKDPSLLDKYRRVLGNTGSSKKAIVAVAHSLANRIRSILLNKQPYEIGRKL